MRKVAIAAVALDGAVGSYDKLYSYIVPDEFPAGMLAGCRVFVPFGRGNTKRIGMVFSVSEGEDSKTLKSIISVMDDTPVLDAEMLGICYWLHDNVFCTYFDAVNTMLPAGLRCKLAGFYSINPEFADVSLLCGDEAIIFSHISKIGETSEEKLKAQFGNCRDILLSLADKGALIHTVAPKRSMGDLTRKWVRSVDGDYLTMKLTPRQREVLDAVIAAGEVSIKELQYFTGVTVSVINSLIKKGILESFERQEFRLPPRTGLKPSNKEVSLNAEQLAAFEGLKSKLLSNTSETALLYGVTGSGKTQVFLKLADECLKHNRGVIIMVPEIALTPQMINLFSSKYQSKVAVFHSAMSLGQRMDEYRRIAAGKAQIAVGTRSAVFAPFKDLGLIVMDEEQEHTYKSEKSPRYNTRDIAALRTKYHGGLLCLSSATPSLESFSKANIGIYGLYKLNKRYNNLSLPEVRVVNMREELKSGNSSDLSRELATLIGEQLKLGNQSIILLNRRGHNTYVSCGECGYVAACDNCSVSLTYHSANKRLMCHYCGYSVPVYSKCPKCGSEFLSFSGAGTQKIEEELSKLFPSARILRLDADSTVTRNSYAVNLGDFAAGKYDIMIGTQMVAKGLDFPKVTLVGVIGADRALAGSDYRGFERTFDLLTQVVGRAGRADRKGIAVIQTSDTDNHIVDLAQSQDYEQFYKEELANRKIQVFPPYCDLCLLWVQSSSEQAAKTAVMQIFSSIKELIGGEYCDQHLIVLGPNAAFIPKVGGKYRYKLLIKCKNSKRFREMILKATAGLAKQDLSVGIDINPEDVM